MFVNPVVAFSVLLRPLMTTAMTGMVLAVLHA